MSGMGPAPPPMPPPAYGMPPPMPKQQSMLPLVGGALLIVSAIIAIAFWAWVMVTVSSAVSILPIGGAAVANIVNICGGIEIVFALIGLLGGAMAIMRKMWGLALVGAILGLFTFGWFGISSILALVALILIAVSHKEFA